MKAPRKIAENSPLPERIKIIKLKSLAPFRLGMPGIACICRRAFEMSARWGTKERTPAIQDESDARRALASLVDLASRGDAQAAKFIHMLAEELTVAMNALAKRDFELWDPILAEASAWPIRYSDIPLEKKLNEDLLARVGRKSILPRAIHHKSAGTPKPTRLDVTTPLNQRLMFCADALNSLSGAACIVLASDNPSAEVFEERLDDLLLDALVKQPQTAGIPTPVIRKLMLEFRQNGQFDLADKKGRASAIFDWLDAEAGRKIQDVDFFRERGLNAQSMGGPDANKVDEWLRIIKKCNTPKGARESFCAETSDADRKNFLLLHRGPKTVETAIRKQILRAIIESQNW
ncbi:MAG: hypothetical protein NTV93_06020 [Verrucomicrobia bacterium]|nr:hypothetical protein [Verrucomicrobiota bacterium]